jgi:hypothetical protein
MLPEDQGSVPQQVTDEGVQTSPIYVGNFSEPRFGKWITEWFGKMHERVRELEWGRKDINRRLGEGAQTFSEIKKMVESVEKKTAPHPKPILPILGFGLTLLMIIVGGAWAAAHYPNRNEFDQVKDHVVRLELHFTNEISSLKLELAELKGTVSSVKEGVQRMEDSQKENSGKLDRILERRK